MVEGNIPILEGKIYSDIKESYRGGFVDVYRPSPKANIQINSYDINSLYPSAMFDYPMPIGEPIYFESFEDSESEQYKNEFGFFYVEIYAPNIYAPILQYKLKNAQGNNFGPSICPIEI
jgi:hypothetical protein